MFGLVVALAAVAQAPEYVDGYKPKVGDKVVLARDEPARKVPIAKSDGAALGFQDIVLDSNDSQYEALLEGSELAEIDAGTPAQIVGDVKYLKDPTIFKIRILSGPSKGKTTFTYTKFCRTPDPAVAKAKADKRKQRGPLDKKAVATDLKDALATANPNEAQKDMGAKKSLVREAVDPICKKYDADYSELNDLATRAGIFVMLNGQKYDVAGNRLRK
jgi:hypothetical protein